MKSGSKSKKFFIRFLLGTISWPFAVAWGLLVTVAGGFILTFLAGIAFLATSVLSLVLVVSLPLRCWRYAVTGEYPEGNELLLWKKAFSDIMGEGPLPSMFSVAFEIVRDAWVFSRKASR